ncbi:HAMP domain-containing sensor histidine kinase [Schlesneria paludicola]|uniref:HAMP domain-containing sensor histidine kinase n=1 Tax=Schlesneria paludicola TaxID=360056 RepID=UPI00029B30BA|nr:HAMP domain-containing sensor histidine kinase [Schlesneria paludicola]
MLSSPLVRRVLWLSAAFSVFCLIVLGLVGLSVPLQDPVSVLWWRLLVTQLFLIAIALPLAAQLMHRWVAPVIDLTRAAQILSEGKHPNRVAAEYEDELGQLTHAFNEMVQNVETRHEELQLSRQQVTSDNEQLATILEAMVEGVIAVDHDQKILLANMAAIQLLDLKSFNVVGRRIWEAIRLPQIHELIQLTLTEHQQKRLEVAVPWTYSTVAVVASRLPGTPCPGVVLVLHDVTELRRLENLRREFVSNVSHELKTPLAAITAYTETLLNGALEDPEVARTFVGRIDEQGDRLNSLILDLLELARIESGEHVFHVSSVEVNDVLAASIDAHQAIAESKQLTLTFTAKTSPLMGQADAEGLRTTIDNLIGNAINYTRPGGVIHIRSGHEGKWVTFEVEDNGVGIPKELQGRIFERFFRVDQARSREVGGTGLGLSIVKHLCQVFGGHIKVRSQVGVGSTFTVYLEASNLSA